MANADIRLGYKNAAWFTTNAALVLEEGQVVNLEQTGTYKLGDGVTALSALSFLGSSGGGTWGSITGTLSDQTDLQAALDDKEDAANKQTDLTPSATKYPTVDAVNAGFAKVYLVPPIVSGQGRPSIGINTASNVTGNNNFIWLSPYFTGKDHVVTGIRTYIGTGVAASTIRLGLYAMGAGNEIGALIEASGTLDSSASGWVTYSFISPISLTAAAYWMAVTVSSGSIGLYRYLQGGIVCFSNSSTPSYSCIYKSGAGYAALPSTISSPTYASGTNLYLMELIVQ